MYTNPAGLVSTEDEDDTPYDMYTKPEQEEGGEKSEGSGEGEGEGKTKEEKQEGDPDSQQLEENIVTDLVNTQLCFMKEVLVHSFHCAFNFPYRMRGKRMRGSRKKRKRRRRRRRRKKSRRKRRKKS